MPTKFTKEARKLPRSLRGFPPPIYLQLPSIGVNISDHAIKFIELIPLKNRFTVGIFDTISLPKGVVQNGDVKDPKVLSAELAKLQKSHKFEFTRFSVPEEKAYIFETDIPPTEDRNVYSVLEFHVSDHVPLSADEAVFDYDITGRDKKGRVTTVNVTVLPRSVVDMFLNVCSDAGIVPLSLEMEAQATARAVIPSGDKLTHLIIDIGRTRTGLFIVEKGLVKYTSTLNLGGDEIVKVISNAGGIPFQEAEIYKQEHGINPEDYSESEFEQIENILSRLTDEIDRRISYWSTRRINKVNRVDSIILVGGNASTPQLKEYLSAKNNLPVSVGNVWTNVFSTDEVTPPIDFNHSLGYASAIGLALSDEM